jgi:Zn-dependent protease
MEHFDILRTLKYLPGIILGLTIHEYSHALVAKLCGDRTSYDQGRVTLNPIKHIDPLGFFLLLVAGFGWAKPVQFNEQNLRNPKTDVLKIAVAGPLSNAVLAMFLSLILIITASLPSGELIEKYGILWEIFMYSISINWALFIFNLIPLPPLDGSHLLFHPFRKYPELYNWLFRYGSMALFGLLIFGMVSGKNILPIGPMINFLFRGFLGLFGYIY